MITCFPPKEIEKDDGGASRFGDLRNLIYNDVNGDPRFATQCDNCFDFAALATSHAVRAMLEKVTDKDLQVFRIFEEYISILVRTKQHVGNASADMSCRLKSRQRHSSGSVKSTSGMVILVRALSTIRKT